MKIVIVGGGIAGVNCALELLLNSSSPELNVILISSTNYVKTVTNWHKIGQFTESFSIRETNEPITKDTRFEIKLETVIGWNSSKKIVETNKNLISYDKLCIATGARPKTIWEGENILYIRDTNSALNLQEKMNNCSDVVIIGNGGIATELAYELRNVNISWIIRDSTISTKFFPADVEKFLIDNLKDGRLTGFKNDGILKRHKFETHEAENTSKPGTIGSSLGPDWCTAINLSKKHQNDFHSVNVIKDSKITDIIKSDNRMIVKTENLKNQETSSITCDFVICGLGVTPNTELWKRDEENLKISENGGIEVNQVFQTSIPDVYGCGDVCSLLNEDCVIWEQKQLWTQARQMSEVCAKSMLFGEEALLSSIYFDMFSHCTTFFGLKTVFLGDYKPSKQEQGKWKIIERVIGDCEYIRCVVVNGRIVGALLLGETNLEETFENLILNETNVDEFDGDFLDPNFDVDDYFD